MITSNNNNRNTMTIEKGLTDNVSLFKWKFNLKIMAYNTINSLWQFVYKLHYHNFVVVVFYNHKMDLQLNSSLLHLIKKNKELEVVDQVLSEKVKNCTSIQS